MIFPQPQVIAETRRFFQKVYAWMFSGLILSGVIAYWVAQHPVFYRTILDNKWVFFSVMGLQLLLVFGLAAGMKHLSATMARLLFLFYCFTTGLTLSVIFLIYTIGSIGLTFFIAALMFGIMSVYGFFTCSDLTKLGQVLFMGLIGLVIASVFNIFIRKSTIDLIISIAGVILFTGLTAYDTQKIRKHNIIGNEGTEEDLKESIIGALDLYLDFINLFLSLLRLVSKRK